jgi:K(+)-stimulated pyrophosphate-energized sodium pump
MAPVAIGYALGYAPLGAYRVGAIAGGALMAIFHANSGAAWGNAKKLVADGYHGGKVSPACAATVIGDAVGDPFKDAAGPAISPLLKVMNLVALLIAPSVVGYSHDTAVRATTAAIAALIVVGAITVAKRRTRRRTAAEKDQMATSAQG